MPVCTHKHGSSELYIICAGQGDMVGAKEMINSFKRVCSSGDPKIGRVALGWGAHPSIPAMTLKQHGVRAYNYVSHRHYSPEQMRDMMRDMGRNKFQLILTPSQTLHSELQKLGVRSCFFPSATAFQPVANQVERAGIGCRASAADSSRSYILEPVRQKYTVEYVDTGKKDTLYRLEELHIKLPQWFSRFKVVLVPLKGRLEVISALTSRPLEVAATGTPFISSANKSYEALFGEDIPYQSNTPEQTISILEDILANYDKHLEVFAKYQAHTLKYNSYDARMATLIEQVRTL